MNNYTYLTLSQIVNRKKAPVIHNIVHPVEALPPSYSLNSHRNFTYDQGNIGSCTANAFCAGYRIMHNIANRDPSFEPSRLYFYYHERLAEGDVAEDVGADVLDGEHFTQVKGVCSEADCPYVEANFAVPPSHTADVNALLHKITSYRLIHIDSNLLTNLKLAIHNNQPVLIAISIYDSFETDVVAQTGIVPVPNKTTESLLGGHELCLIGYDDTKKMFTVLNSWGSWGDNGVCYIPYAYLADPDLGHEFTVFTI